MTPGTRLEALHSAGLLTEAELFGFEDRLADFLEIQTAFGSAVTVELARTNEVVGKVQAMVVLNEGLTKDAAFARQARRKFV